MQRSVHKTNHRVILLVGTVIFVGCGIQSISGSGAGSSGGMATGYTPQKGTIKISYNNTITFRDDLSGSVDAAFARIADGDTNIQETLREYLVPARKVLVENYGLAVDFPTPTPQPSSSSFYLKLVSLLWQEHPSNKFTELADDCSGCRFRLNVHSLDAKVRFDPNQSHTLFIEANIELRIERTNDTEPNPVWEDVAVNQERVFALSLTLRKDLNNAYYRFLKSKGIKVTSNFRGSGEP